MAKIRNGLLRVLNGLIFVAIFSALNAGWMTAYAILFGRLEMDISFRIFYGIMTVAAFLLGADIFPRRKPKEDGWE